MNFNTNDLFFIDKVIGDGHIPFSQEIPNAQIDPRAQTWTEELHFNFKVLKLLFIFGIGIVLIYFRTVCCPESFVEMGSHSN